MYKKVLDYDKIQEYYDKVQSMRKTAKHFNINLQTLQYAQKKGWFSPNIRDENTKKIISKSESHENTKNIEKIKIEIEKETVDNDSKTNDHKTETSTFDELFMIEEKND